jgi:hypothetical protein
MQYLGLSSGIDLPGGGAPAYGIDLPGGGAAARPLQHTFDPALERSLASM